MDSQQGTSGAAGDHVKTFGGPSLLEKGKDKLGEWEEDTSAHGSHGAPIEVSFPTEEPISLSEKMDRKLFSKRREADGCQEVTIFRAPKNIRESKREMFEPTAVSIGPYYRGLPHLRAMEELKWSFFQDYLDREECASSEDCIRKIKEVEKRARCCYSEPFDMSSDDFVEMMVLDGCFIIEYFHKCLETSDYDFENREGWISGFIAIDMILLENQIPFFIIETLHGSPFDPQYLKDIASILTGLIPIEASSHPQKIHHLLHLCHYYIVPTRPTPHAASEPNQNHHPFLNSIRAFPILKNSLSKKEEELDISKGWVIPCATELEEAGVKFKNLKQSNDITKITFQSGTLVIPRLIISSDVMPLFMNLLAFEQCIPQLLAITGDVRPFHFSTYMAFMHDLLKTEQDVKILQTKGIFQNLLSSGEEVTHFFQQSYVITPYDHYLAELYMKINKYCESRHHRYRAKLSRDYFSNPWSIMALIAATLLLCLTIIQSFMSVYSYILPSNPPSSPPS